jgi:hypothetical protein
MDELMALSDLLITKPGGITVSEGVALGVPMIFIEPIPGQEEANADYFVEHGAGVKARSLPVLIYKLGQLVRDPERLADMSKRAKAISRAFAAKNIELFSQFDYDYIVLNSAGCGSFMKEYGTLVDYFGAQKDMREKVIRVLHNLSFVEDPTRVLRAIRFEQRFGFQIAKHTQNLMRNVVKMG